jgi:anti-sigma factor RsiW
MTCQELVAFLMDYLDGDLPEATRLHFEEHLAECTDCVAYLATYREAVRLGKAACAEAEGTAPPEVPEDLVQAVLSARRRG